MRLILAGAILLTLTGCWRSKAKVSDQPTRVSQFAATPLPVPPPPPDPVPVAVEVTSAKTEVAAAQAGVRQVVQMAAAIPGALPAVSTLNSADFHLTEAVHRLDAADARVAELTQQLHASDQAHQQAQAIIKADVDRLKAAATQDAAANAKTVGALESEIVKLKDEQLNRIQFWLYMIGTAMTFGGLIGLYLSIRTGFILGNTFGPLISFGGIVVIGFARALPKLADYAEVGVGVICVVLVIVVAVTGYKALHHTPRISGGKKDAT